MKQNIRLCIVYWDLGLGGIQKRIRDLVEHIVREKNCEVYILLRRKSKNGFDNQIIQHQRVFIRYYPYTQTLRPPLGFVFWIIGQYLSIKPNVVLTFQSLLSTLLVICKHIFFWMPVRLVLNEGAVTSISLAIDDISFQGILVRMFYRFADLIIVPTDACKYDLIHQYGIPNKKISIIGNWTLFSPSTPLPSYYDIVFVGRFSREKNPLFMFFLANELRKQNMAIQVALIGNGYMLSSLQVYIDKNHLKNTIKIFPFTNTVRSIIRRAKILIVPSINEGMPNVVLESAMCQIPAVISAFPGAHDVVIHGQTGYIYKTKEEAVNYIKNLLLHEKKRKRIGRKAQTYIQKNFGIDTQKRFITQLFN